jgi:hypothetical protein
VNRIGTVSAQTATGMHERIACGQRLRFVSKRWVRERYGERKNGGPHDHDGKKDDERQGQCDGE